MKGLILFPCIRRPKSPLVSLTLSAPSVNVEKILSIKTMDLCGVCVCARARVCVCVCVCLCLCLCLCAVHE